MSVLNTAKNPGREKRLFEFTQGVDVDAHLADAEIKVQKAWVNALTQLGVISSPQKQEVISALDEALGLMLQEAFPWRVEDEDIHMNLERILVEKLGEVGKKIHLGRSRNDLIATTLRLFVRDSIQGLQKTASQLILTLCQKSEQSIDVMIPGMTHLQNGQPVRVSHILLAHGWALYRDQRRWAAAQMLAMESMPLGSAALTGTTLPVNLDEIAAELGFASPSWNSYDSVGDRDFLVDSLYGLSTLGVHLSRLSEDLIYWASTPVGLLCLPKDWSTGSSIMPNKRNPDVPELIRAKSTHWIAGSFNALTLMKGLPSGYNSDLHELKSILIRNFSEAQKSLEVLERFVSSMEFNPKAADTLLQKGHILATELANHWTQKGMSFREAYQKTAALIEQADAQGVSIEQLAQEIEGISLSMEGAVEARNCQGGTSRSSVMRSCAVLRAKLIQF